MSGKNKKPPRQPEKYNLKRLRASVVLGIPAYIIITSPLLVLDLIAGTFIIASVIETKGGVVKDIFNFQVKNEDKINKIKNKVQFILKAGVIYAAVRIFPVSSTVIFMVDMVIGAATVIKIIDPKSRIPSREEQGYTDGKVNSKEYEEFLRRESNNFNYGPASESKTKYYKKSVNKSSAKGPDLEKDIRFDF